MRAVVFTCALLAALSAPAAAAPADEAGLLPAQQSGHDKPTPRPRASGEGRPVLLPPPLAAVEPVVVAPDASPAAAAPVKRRFVIPWQTGVFQ